MTDYEFTYCEILWNKLKDCVKGRVYVDVKDDELRIYIECDEFKFEYFEKDFGYKLILGLIPCDGIRDLIVTKYVKYIHNLTEKRVLYL